MADEKKIMVNEADLSAVSGGTDDGTFTQRLTVGGCDGGYIALRSSPTYDDNNELEPLYDGTVLYSDGTTEMGFRFNQSSCTYVHVKVEKTNTIGWVDSKYVY